MARRVTWLVAVAVALFAGCGGDDAPKPGQTVLTVWDWHAADPSKGAGLWLMNIDKAFERLHPNIKVKHVAQSHNEYYQIFMTAAASKSGPDVVMLHQGSRVLDLRDSLRPLTDYVTPEFRKKIVGWDVTCENFDPAGTPYAVPIAVQGLLWYYNKKVLREAGVAFDGTAMPWGEFLDRCAALRKAGKAGIAVGEKEGDWAAWFLNSAAFQTLTAAERDALGRGELAWTDPKVVALLERLKELNDRGCFQDGFMSTALWPDARYVFLRGQAGFFLGLISDVAHWKEFGKFFGPENVGVMVCPTFQPGPDADRFPIGGAFAYAVTAWSRCPREAFDYIAFVANEENARTFLTEVGSFPANQSYDRSLLTDPTAKVIAEWLASGRTGSQMTGKCPMALGDVLNRECQRLLSGQATVAEAAAAIEKAVPRK